MARKRKPAPDDPRTVALTHDDGRTTMATPEAAAALEHYGWTRDEQLDDVTVAIEKATAPLHDEIARLKAELASGHGDEIPDGANDRIAWIGNDPAKAERAQADEATRPTPRTTVTEHIASVLNQSKED